MKMFNLFLLIAVLCLASAANAIVVSFSTDGGSNDGTDIELNAVPGGSYSISILSDTEGIYGAYVSYLEQDLPSAGDVPIANVVPTTNAGNLSAVVDYSVSDFMDIELTVADSQGLIGSGVQFNFDLNIAGDWDQQPFDIWLTGPNDPEFIPSAFLHVVPEPMTLVLLGLGGLLLRRRT